METETKAMSLQECVDKICKKDEGYPDYRGIPWEQVAELYKDSCLAAQREKEIQERFKHILHVEPQNCPSCDKDKQQSFICFDCAKKMVDDALAAQKAELETLKKERDELFTLHHEARESITQEKAKAFDEGCDDQRKLWIKQMPVGHLVKREISAMQFVEYIESKLKPVNPYRQDK